jgi:hypothetical protein
MREVFIRAFDNLMNRDSGPFHLRLYLQPLMATILAIRVGWSDAWQGRAILLRTLMREPARTAAMTRNLWKIAGKVFLVAVVLDVAYQLIVFQWIYPVETLIVATVLALVPCMIVRAIGNQIVTAIRQRRLKDEGRRPPPGSTAMIDQAAAPDNHRETNSETLPHHSE